MSRTFNTAPLRVQAHTLPAHAVYIFHTYDCDRGRVECSYRPGEVPERDWPGDRCAAMPEFCSGHGGSRRHQGAVADLHEGATRAAVRDQLRDATRAANTARVAGVETFDDGTAAADWDLDICYRGYDVADWLW